MKKKITAFLLLMCMLVGMLGNVDVYAAESAYKFNNLTQVKHTQQTHIYGGEEGICEYQVTFTLDNMTAGNWSLLAYQLSSGAYYIMVISDESFTMDFTVSQEGEIIEESSHRPDFVPTSETKTVFIESLEENGLYYTYYSTLALDYSLLNTVNIPYLKLPDDVTYKTAVSYVIDLFKTYNGDLTQSDDYFFEFDVDTASYDKDLGYLTNLKFQVLNRTTFDELNENNIPTTGDGSFKFKWDDTSTTGVSLLDENIYVQLFTSAGAINSIGTDIGQQLITDVNLNYVDRYSANNLNLIVSVTDYFAASNADYENWYENFSWWHIQTQGVVRRDTAYLRLIRINDDGSWSYGGYVRATLGRGVNDNKIDSLTPDLDVDPDGPSGGLPTTEGSGPDDDSAADDADGNDGSDSSDASFNDIWDVFQAFLDGISSLQSSIGKVPELIGHTFKAFPSQIITMIGVGFILAIFLRIIGR